MAIIPFEYHGSIWPIFISNTAVYLFALIVSKIYTIKHKKWMNLQHDNAFYENVQESHLHIVVSYQKNKQEKLSNTFIMHPGKTYSN